MARSFALEDNRLEFFRSDSQKHYWIGAAGTAAGAQALRGLGLSKRPATALAAFGMIGVGLGKEFALDNQASGNDLMADGLGVLTGVLATLSFRFDPSFGAESP